MQGNDVARLGLEEVLHKCGGFVRTDPAISDRHAPKYTYTIGSSVDFIHVGESAESAHFELIHRGYRAAEDLETLDMVRRSPGIFAKGRRILVIGSIWERIFGQRNFRYGLMIQQGVGDKRVLSLHNLDNRFEPHTLVAGVRP